MAAELLQILELAKSFEGQADAQNFKLAINQHARLIDRQTGLVNQLTATVEQQAKDLRTLQAEQASDGSHATFGILLALIVAISLVGIVWIDRLQKRIKALESVNVPAPTPAVTE